MKRVLLLAASVLATVALGMFDSADCNVVVSMSQGRQVYNGTATGNPTSSPLEALTGEEWMLLFQGGRTLPWWTTASNWDTLNERHRCGTDAEIDRVVFIFDPRQSSSNSGTNMIENLTTVGSIVASRYPDAEFNPTLLVGADSHVVCVGNGATASKTHSERITVLELSTFTVGPDLDVPCSEYADALGHLTNAGASNANGQLASAYGN